jgi:uncharacterized protein with HEPN domain
MKRDDSVYIRHIADAIDRIETYTSGVDENTFLTDRLKPLHYAFSQKRITEIEASEKSS